MKYKCPVCKKKELIKQVYTEEVCNDCGHVNHQPHNNKRLREYGKEEAKGNE